MDTNMIIIAKSETADSRTCDFANVSKGTLMISSRQHIDDVQRGMRMFGRMLARAGIDHDSDKITGIDEFHSDFVNGFKTTGWWDKHRKITRHHLQMADGVRDDVNLVDVIEMIVDCVMAGMARAGKVYEVTIPDEVLEKAFKNTVALIKSKVVVSQSEEG